MVDHLRDMVEWRRKGDEAYMDGDTGVSADAMLFHQPCKRKST